MSENFSLRRDHPRGPALLTNRRAGTAACGPSLASIATTRHIPIPFLPALAARYFATILGIVCGPSLPSFATTRYVRSITFLATLAASYFITKRERPSHV